MLIFKALRYDMLKRDNTDMPPTHLSTNGMSHHAFTPSHRMSPNLLSVLLQMLISSVITRRLKLIRNCEFVCGLNRSFISWVHLKHLLLSVSEAVYRAGETSIKQASTNRGGRLVLRVVLKVSEPTVCFCILKIFVAVM